MTVLKLHKKNVSIREIAERVNRSKSVIGRIVKTYKDTGRVLSQNKMGRPRKTSARQDKAIQRMALRDFSPPLHKFIETCKMQTLSMCSDALY